jgi:protein-L-isoaspartate(D-aspartate) O-methyltransferase
MWLCALRRKLFLPGIADHYFAGLWSYARSTMLAAGARSGIYLRAMLHYPGEERSVSEFDQARNHMVDCQIRPSDVTDGSILAAFMHVDRHAFTPRSRLATAYADGEVITGDNRVMMRPRDMAKLIQAAEIKPSELVLDIAGGRGYSCAVLARLAETVVGLEDDEDSLSRSSDLLSAAGADNAVVIKGDLKAGVPGQGPFDVIFVNGSIEEVPAAWLEQLSDGGRLVAVIRRGPIGKATVFTCSDAGIGERVVFDSNASLLPGFEAEKAFAL